ncbi:hypothetical protein FVE85_2362 [Porphyridium purpureum]|uniref:Uncharacterized protein n=1 Tax=Porphyridium purpureum TaxID=35688 RepID=A0A5J4Z0H8_PORPP|nr:hypothetical protein FVE85_2362 [Porphyridium purpureum]|eukprot:POR9680..scf209_3
MARPERLPPPRTAAGVQSALASEYGHAPNANGAAAVTQVNSRVVSPWANGSVTVARETLAAPAAPIVSSRIPIGYGRQTPPQPQSVRSAPPAPGATSEEMQAVADSQAPLHDELASIDENGFLVSVQIYDERNKRVETLRQVAFADGVRILRARADAEFRVQASWFRPSSLFFPQSEFPNYAELLVDGNSVCQKYLKRKPDALGEREIWTCVFDRFRPPGDVYQTLKFELRYDVDAAIAAGATLRSLFSSETGVEATSAPRCGTLTVRFRACKPLGRVGTEVPALVPGAARIESDPSRSLICEPTVAAVPGSDAPTSSLRLLKVEFVPSRLQTEICMRYHSEQLFDLLVPEDAFVSDPIHATFNRALNDWIFERVSMDSDDHGLISNENNLLAATSRTRKGKEPVRGAQPGLPSEKNAPPQTGTRPVAEPHLPIVAPIDDALYGDLPLEPEICVAEPTQATEQKVHRLSIDPVARARDLKMFGAFDDDDEELMKELQEEKKVTRLEEVFRPEQAENGLNGASRADAFERPPVHTKAVATDARSNAFEALPNAAPTDRQPENVQSLDDLNDEVSLSQRWYGMGLKTHSNSIAETGDIRTDTVWPLQATNTADSPPIIKEPAARAPSAAQPRFKEKEKGRSSEFGKRAAFLNTGQSMARAFSGKARPPFDRSPLPEPPPFEDDEDVHMHDEGSVKESGNDTTNSGAPLIHPGTTSSQISAPELPLVQDDEDVLMLDKGGVNESRNAATNMIAPSTYRGSPSSNISARELLRLAHDDDVHMHDDRSVRQSGELPTKSVAPDIHPRTPTFQASPPQLPSLEDNEDVHMHEERSVKRSGKAAGYSSADGRDPGTTNFRNRLPPAKADVKAGKSDEGRKQLAVSSSSAPHERAPTSHEASPWRTLPTNTFTETGRANNQEDVEKDDDESRGRWSGRRAQSECNQQ